MVLPTIPRAGHILASFVDRLEFRERLREYSVWNVWSEVVGAAIAAHAEPTRIEDGKLIIRVADSVWMQELQFLKEDIRTRLNERVGANLVKGIYLVLGAVRERRTKIEATPIHPVDEERIAALVPNTSHPEIERAIRRVARARARRLGPDTSP